MTYLNAERAKKAALMTGTKRKMDTDALDRLEVKRHRLQDDMEALQASAEELADGRQCQLADLETALDRLMSRHPHHVASWRDLVTMERERQGRGQGHAAVASGGNLDTTGHRPHRLQDDMEVIFGAFHVKSIKKLPDWL